MHLSTFLILPLSHLAFGSVLQARAACNADNCARAVTGTSTGITPALTVRRSDCSSFQKTTVTPAPITTTITITATGNLSFTPILSPTTTPFASTSPSAVPPYASACSGSSRYASACSCFNITATTTTLPPLTSTSTITVLPTPSTQCTNPGVCGTFQNCGASETCFCGGGVESGSTICFADEACDGATSCVTDGDCEGTGRGRCLLSSCCPGGVCVAVDSCVNLNRKRGGVGREKVGWSGGGGDVDEWVEVRRGFGV